MLLYTLLGLPCPADHSDAFKVFADQLSDHFINESHLKGLTSIAFNSELHGIGEPEFYAGIYAFYALAKLQQVDACIGLSDYLNQSVSLDHNWVEAYIPAVVMLGEASIHTLIHASKRINIEYLYVYTESLGCLANQFPEYRDDILECFDELLTLVSMCAVPEHALFSGETAILIGWMEMHAVERMDMIRVLHAQGVFDWNFVGDFNHVCECLLPNQKFMLG